MWITEPEPYRPDLVLWMQMPDELVLKAVVLDPQQPETFSQTFLDATRAPMVGPPRRPQRIRVADTALAAELRAAVGDLIPITVAPTPEIDRVVQIMAETLPKDSEAPGYLEDGRVSEASVETLFGAARMLYHAAPWKVAADSQVVRIDVPALGIRGACLSVGHRSVGRESRLHPLPFPASLRLVCGARRERAAGGRATRLWRGAPGAHFRPHRRCCARDAA
jgi:hypothetical protein